MQGGDISNGSQACFLVVFEGLLGIPPKEEPRKRPWKRRNTSARAVIAEYEINIVLLHQIRRVAYPVEVVTFLGPQYADAITERLDDLHALVRRVWSTTPAELARVHTVLPDVVAVYDPDARRAFAAYGSLGRHLLPVNAAHLGAS